MYMVCPSGKSPCVTCFPDGEFLSQNSTINSRSNEVMIHSRGKRISDVWIIFLMYGILQDPKWLAYELKFFTKELYKNSLWMA